MLDQWKQEYRDLNMLNMNVFGQQIKRKNGLPQGSELAPALFNIYTTWILRDLDARGMLENFDVAIFADNWVIRGLNEQSLKEKVLEINAFIFAEYKLQFTMDEAEFVEIVELADGRPVVLDQTQFKSVKFLGVNWNIYLRKAYFDQREYQWKFPKIKLSPGYLVFKVIKKFIVPKFRYYFNYLEIVSPNEAQRYRKWFKEKMYGYLKKNLNMLNIQDKMVEQMIAPSEPNKIWRKFLGPYLATNKEICNSNGKLTDDQVRLLGKLKEVAEEILKNDYKIGIYQMSNYIFTNEFAYHYFRLNDKNQTNKQRNRTWMVVDTLYYAITAEKRLSTVIFQEQERFMNKTLRKRSYKFL